MAIPPNFPQVSSDEKQCYDSFIEYTSDSNIEGYANGWNLEKLIELTYKAYSVIQKTNPILNHGASRTGLIPGCQWGLDHLSDIKQRLSKAIEYKRDYYENTLMGMITKYILKCFGMWNGGDTAAIIEAEDFLIDHDSRLPLIKSYGGVYVRRTFFPLVPDQFTSTIWWVRSNLNTGSFYNYNPRRDIPVDPNWESQALPMRKQTIRFDALDPHNPDRIFSRV